MSIIWCGGEDIDFPVYTGERQINTSSGHFDSKFSRCAIRTSESLGGMIQTKAFTPMTDFWFSVQLYNFCWNTSVEGLYGIAFRDTSAGNCMFGLGPHSNGPTKLNLSKHDFETGTNTYLDQADDTFYEDVLHKLDFHLTNYGSNANIKVWHNTKLVIDYTGDLTFNSSTGIDSFYFASWTQFVRLGVSVSELILADEDTRLMRVKTLAPNASGDTNDWTNDYDSVDEITLSDADYIEADTAEYDFQCNLTGMPTGDYNVRAVKGMARVADVIGGLDVQLGVKTNSSVDLGNQEILDSNWQEIEIIYNQNPITTSNWTPTEIEALQAMLRSKTA